MLNDAVQTLEIQEDLSTAWLEVYVVILTFGTILIRSKDPEPAFKLLKGIVILLKFTEMKFLQGICHTSSVKDKKRDQNNSILLVLGHYHSSICIDKTTKNLLTCLNQVVLLKNSSKNSKNSILLA